MRSTLTIAFLFSAFLFLGCQPKENKHPNIIFIMADDLGYGDLGVYDENSLVPTPNLNKLAGEGMRFTNAYCPVSVCSPSRYALMTGRYPWKSWRKSGVMKNYERSMIDDEILTLPEMLQESGYTTAGFGKWHLGTKFQTLDGENPAGFQKFRADDNGANLDLTKPVLDGPIDHGFDYWNGFSCASETWLFENDQIYGAVGHDLYTIEQTPNKDHIQVIPLADHLPFIIDHTLKYLEKQSKGEQPFFLYFSPYVPHIPLAVSEEFKGATKAGLYGDYVHELDHYLGKVLSKLDELEIADETIIFFGSDNGSQFRLTSPELDSIPITNNPRDVFDGSKMQGHKPNGILRGTKWSIYEGGVRMPFIVKWKDKVKSGTISSAIVGMNDIMATVAEIVGFEVENQAEDSQSQLSSLLGKDVIHRTEIVLQSSGKDFAIRERRWKYVWKSKENISELYDLESDPSEQNNLIDSEQSRVQEMHFKLFGYIQNDIE